MVESGDKRSSEYLSRVDLMVFYVLRIARVLLHNIYIE
jgi:hypothetical protein